MRFEAKLDAPAHILVAEDDVEQAQVLAEYLIEEGYLVDVAQNPEDAVAKLARAPELVLLDWVGMLTPTLFQTFNRLPERPALVLVSADDRGARAAEQIGADAFLPKPYDLGDLAFVLATALKGKRLVRQAMTEEGSAV